MYGNEYSSIHQAEVENIKRKIEAKQRNLDAITTVKGYKDPAAKLVKTQSYYISQLDNRPKILETRCKEVEDKIALKNTKYNSALSSIDYKIQQLELEKTLLTNKHNEEIKRLENNIIDIKNNDPETKRLEKEIDTLSDQILNARTTQSANKTEIVIIEELKALKQQLKDAELQYKESIDAQEFLAKKEKETEEVKDEMWHPWSELKNMNEEEKIVIKETKKNNRLYPEGKPTELPREQDKTLEQFKSVISHMSETNYSLPPPSIPTPIISNTKSPKPIVNNPIRPFKMSENVLAVERELEENRAIYRKESVKAIDEQRKRYREKEARLKQLYFDAEISRDELEERLQELRGWEEGQ